MSHAVSRVLRFASFGAVVCAVTAFMPSRVATPAPGMSFKLKVVLRHAAATGKSGRAITLMGHGLAAAGKGRIEIDTVDVPSWVRKGDFFIVRDSTNTFHAMPRTMTVRRLNAPLVNPLEGISDRLTSGMGSPRSLKVDFDTISLNESVNGYDTRHFRITADVVYPVGSRNVTQKVVIDQWLAKVSMPILNPFSSRIRGLPEAPAVNAAYREFIRTLAAANRIYGDGVTVRTVTATSYIYGPGLGEDYLQSVDLTDLQSVDVDDREFELSANYKLQRAGRDTVKPPTQPRDR